MVNIALFISGRLTCYETDLILLLQRLSTNDNIKIHLFCSINDIYNDYYKIAEEVLSPWLCKIEYEEYKIPYDFIENKHPETLIQIVNGIKQPYTVLSCFYNDYKAYKMIEEYQTEKNIKFDICCKIRPDIIFNNIFPEIFLEKDTMTLYSCIPPDIIRIRGDLRTNLCLCDAFAFGCMETMKQYCKTYNFILNENNIKNGNYRINFEPCLTESFFNEAFPIDSDDCYIHMNNAYNKSKFNVIYFTCPYYLNKTRRIRDNNITETIWYRFDQIS